VVGATDERGPGVSVAHIVCREMSKARRSWPPKFASTSKRGLYRTKCRAKFDLRAVAQNVTGKIQRFKLRGTPSDR